MTDSLNDCPICGLSGAHPAHIPSCPRFKLEAARPTSVDLFHTAIEKAAIAAMPKYTNLPVSIDSQNESIQTDTLIEETHPTWTQVNSVDEMEEFYMSRLPAIREAARKCGYAIGLHGSCRRDFDLMAMPWVEDCTDADTLAREIQKAACGFQMQKYTWENKPHGRIAVSMPICWTAEHMKALSTGHIDLSVIICASCSEIRVLAEDSPMQTDEHKLFKAWEATQGGNIDQANYEAWKAGYRNGQKREISYWQPIETAPKDSEHGIIARKGYAVFWTNWDDEGGIWFTQNLYYEDSHYAKKHGSKEWQPTHWMPYTHIEGGS